MPSKDAGRKKYLKKSFGEVPESLAEFSKHTPEIMDAYAAMRKKVFLPSPEGEFEKKFYELMIIAINCARGTVEGARLHVKSAIEAGATLQEIHRVLAVVAFSCGMPTYTTYGYSVMKEAEKVFSAKRKR